MSQRLYLLDTSVILPLVRGSALGQRIEQRYRLQSSPHRSLVSVVSLAEAQVIAARNNWGAPKLAALAHALGELVVVDIHHKAVIDAYVQLELISQQQSGGSRNMGKNDLWIAACAKAASATLLTADNDFSHLIPQHLDGELISPADSSEKE